MKSCASKTAAIGVIKYMDSRLNAEIRYKSIIRLITVSKVICTLGLLGLI